MARAHARAIGAPPRGGAPAAQNGAVPDDGAARIEPPDPPQEAVERAVGLLDADGEVLAGRVAAAALDRGVERHVLRTPLGDEPLVVARHALHVIRHHDLLARPPHRHG